MKRERARKPNAMDAHVTELKRKGDELLSKAKRLHLDAEKLETEGSALHDAADQTARVADSMRRKSRAKAVATP